MFPEQTLIIIVLYLPSNCLFINLQYINPINKTSIPDKSSWDS